mmetsp:Transcript_743/g.2625  ORF Transcript_743/g.2625 Transcript_743/m.2625 type:complete len:201 (-) Transcript_743:382-984(-)|eukprot:scaffold196124_cov28-Tisochrysis_lutea.AAC.2
MAAHGSCRMRCSMTSVPQATIGPPSVGSATKMACAPDPWERSNCAAKSSAVIGGATLSCASRLRYAPWSSAVVSRLSTKERPLPTLPSPDEHVGIRIWWRRAVLLRSRLARRCAMLSAPAKKASHVVASAAECMREREPIHKLVTAIASAPSPAARVAFTRREGALPVRSRSISMTICASLKPSERKDSLASPLTSAMIL